MMTWNLVDRELLDHGEADRARQISSPLDIAPHTGRLTNGESIPAMVGSIIITNFALRRGRL